MLHKKAPAAADAAITLPDTALTMIKDCASAIQLDVARAGPCAHANTPPDMGPSDPTSSMAPARLGDATDRPAPTVPPRIMFLTDMLALVINGFV